MTRELTMSEKAEYDALIKTVKQLNIFGEEEELNEKDFIITPDTTEDNEKIF
ncbi:hypothetical protein [Butyrivibrio sp. AC2005]|uniref:hypothetical protein n=1 Tax=Butyrivibrio sp. AC2005 TaxID=1280672 RepID=UPI000421E01D|nr:hypothetical protein [Butyrivibrio sp. AC2005]